MGFFSVRLFCFWSSLFLDFFSFGWLFFFSSFFLCIQRFFRSCWFTWPCWRDRDSTTLSWFYGKTNGCVMPLSGETWRHWGDAGRAFERFYLTDCWQWDGGEGEGFSVNFDVGRFLWFIKRHCRVGCMPMPDWIQAMHSMVIAPEAVTDNQTSPSYRIGVNRLEGPFPTFQICMICVRSSIVNQTSLLHNRPLANLSEHKTKSKTIKSRSRSVNVN